MIDELFAFIFVVCGGVIGFLLGRKDPPAPRIFIVEGGKAAELPADTGVKKSPVLFNGLTIDEIKAAEGKDVPPAPDH